MPSPSAFRRAAACLALLALFPCACSQRDHKAALSRFPIGIYAVDDPRHLARLSEAGFDSFQTYRQSPALLASLAKEARRLAMRMVSAPDELENGKASLARDWPIDAWYLCGEPDVAKLPRAALQAMSDRTRAWDPDRPQTFDIGEGAPAKVYGGVGDILLMDWYPVPHLPLDSVADQVDLAMRGLPKGKPLWMIIQAYDWADEVIDPKKRKGLRFPSHAEIRFMSYLSVLHGARGLFYFALPKLGKTLFDYPELWQAVAGTAREMKAMQPIFERGRRIAPPFSGEASGLETGAWRYRGRDYVVILNRKFSAKLTVPDELLRGDWRPLFESRRDPKELLERAGAQWRLGPSRVLVLEGSLRLRDMI